MLELHCNDSLTGGLQQSCNRKMDESPPKTKGVTQCYCSNNMYPAITIPTRPLARNTSMEMWVCMC